MSARANLSRMTSVRGMDPQSVLRALAPPTEREEPPHKP
jgi:hypothetical protein